MKLEAVIVCVNYADFLEHTLPINIQYFDRLVVVTSPSDKDTQHLCRKFGIDFIDTLEMYDSGDKFNKGRLINLGLSHLRNDGWIIHLDADIVLPHKFKQMLSHADLDEKSIYGADRLNCVGYEHWLKYKDYTVPQHQYRYMVTPTKEFPLGSRLLHQEYGYCPIGYFQMWHSSTRRKYPIVSGSAENDDVLFSVQWPRDKRVLLPQFFVYHLESEECQMGANWNGRTTKRFGPERHHHRHHRRHRHHHHHHHYCNSELIEKAKLWSKDEK